MPTRKITNVLLLGPTGSTGAPILAALRHHNRFNISIATRDASKVAPELDLKVFSVDYTNPSSLDAAFAGQDAVVSALTTFSVPLQRTIIDAAIRAGVQRFMPSEYGIDTSRPVSEAFLPPVKMKRDTIAYLREKEGQGAGHLSWTALCVGAYFDWAMLNGFGGFEFSTGVAKILGPDDVPFEATNLERIGDAVVRCLEKAELTTNRYVYVHSFRVTQGEVLRAMNAASEREWKREEVGLEEMYKSGKATISKTELNTGAAMMIGAVLKGYGKEEKLNDFEEKAQEWGQKLGLEDEDLDEVCRRIVATHGP